VYADVLLAVLARLAVWALTGTKAILRWDPPVSVKDVLTLEFRPRDAVQRCSFHGIDRVFAEDFDHCSDLAVGSE
jgi:hypothetical protein